MQVEVNSSRFEFSHARAPRGVGFWWFESRDRSQQFQHQGSFAEARRAAVAWARANNVREVFVAP
jgi:hypothetical protein